MTLEKIQSLQDVIISYTNRGLDIEDVIDNKDNLSDTTIELLENLCHDVEEILPELINMVVSNDTKSKAITYIEEIPKIIEEFSNLNKE